MAISIKPGDLLSRAVRSAIDGAGGRKIDTFLEFSDTDQDGGGGIVGLVQRVVGFLSQKAFDLVRWGLSRISFTAIFSWIVNGVTRIAMFDWNMTDTEIANSQMNNNLAIISRWGAATGAGLGWLTGIGLGYGLGMTVPVIGGGVLAKALAGAVTREALEEMRYHLLSAIRGTATTALGNTALGAYARFRRAIRGMDRDTLTGLVGEGAATWIKDVWGSDGAPILSIANEIEEGIESIDNRYVRTFIEAGVEEYFDSFIEAGYIVAMGLDDAYAQYRMGQSSPTPTTPRAIKIYPDAKEPTEYLYLAGKEADVRAKAEEIITDARIIGNREIGEWVGQPVQDFIRAVPHRRLATIIFKSIPGKAWYLPDGRKAATARYSIPDLEANITWSELKIATRAYDWGPWRATANLNNGRQMAVYGATREIAVDKLKDLLELSTADIVSLSATQELDRTPARRKDVTRMYPYKLKLLVRRYDPDGSSYIDEEGNAYTEYTDAIPIWQDEEPPDFDQLLI